MTLKRFFAILPIPVLSSFACTTPNRSTLDSFSDEKVHLVIAAKPSSRDQRLWICNKDKVAPNTSVQGYPVSIGAGKTGKGFSDRVSATERGQNLSNLTPVGKFVISNFGMIGRQWHSL